MSLDAHTAVKQDEGPLTSNITYTDYSKLFLGPGRPQNEDDANIFCLLGIGTEVKEHRKELLHFSSQNISVKPHCPSLLSVRACVRVCVRAVRLCVRQKEGEREGVCVRVCVLTFLSVCVSVCLCVFDLVLFPRSSFICVRSCVREELLRERVHL